MEYGLYQTENYFQTFNFFFSFYKGVTFSEQYNVSKEISGVENKFEII